MSVNNCDVYMEVVAMAGPSSCHGAVLASQVWSHQSYVYRNRIGEKKNLSAYTEIYILRTLIAFISFLFTTKVMAVPFRRDHRAQ